MAQEDNLLFEYLCMAFPYGVKGLRTYNKEEVVELSGVLPCIVSGNPDKPFIELQFTNLDCCVIEKFKPFLRSMSSMTDEEKEQLKSLYDAENVTNESICFLEGGTLEEYEAETSFVFCYCIVKWLLQHHFDFIGLIPKDLAIEINESNNPYENNM